MTFPRFNPFARSPIASSYCSLLLIASCITACGDDGSNAADDHAADAGTDIQADSFSDGASDSADSTPDSSPDGSAPDSTTPDVTPDTAQDGISGGDGTCGSPAGFDVDGDSWVAIGTTAGADHILAGTCEDEGGPEVVIAWTAPRDGTITARLEAQDPILYVREGACDDDGAELACNDDASDDELNSQVVIEVMADETYYFVAEAFDVEEVSEFELTLRYTEALPALLPPGVWISDAYGTALVVSETRFDTYEFGSSHCLLSEGDQIAALRSAFVDISITDEGINVLEHGSVASIFARQADALPDVCTTSLLPTVGDEDYVFDPVQHLEIIIDAFDNHYAFFTLRDFDWAGAVQTARDAVTSDTTPAQLLDAITDLLGVTGDGHVGLAAQLDGEEPILFEASLLPFVERIEEEFEASDSELSLDDFATLQFTRQAAAIDSNFSSLGGDALGLRWGRSGQIGYLRFPNFAFDNDADIHEQVDDALTELGDIDSLIIDVRLNFGGNDTQALAVASFFADGPRPAFSKSARLGDGFTPEYDVVVPACSATNCLPDLPIALLVSESTVSAGEIFALAMREIPTVTLIGQPTSGELSDIFARSLPNGWTVGMSNERYLSVDGELFESVGVPVDVTFEGDLFDVAIRDSGTDPFTLFVLDRLQD